MPPILMYHHIGDPPAASREKPALFVAMDQFERQLAWLKKKGFSSISLDELRAGFIAQKVLPDRAVALTFDDGYLDNYEAAFPLLQQYGFSATFFVTTGCIGQRDAYGHAHMDAGQIRELHRAGMAIGSHTVSHGWLGKMPLEQAREELRQSKAALEEIISAPVDWLCYPSGSFSDEVIEAAREIGYAGACSVIRDNRVAPHQLFWMPRVMIMRDTPPWRLAYLFSDLYHFLHARKNRKRWEKR